VQAQVQKSRSEGRREGNSNEPPRGTCKRPGHPVEGDVISGLEKQEASGKLVELGESQGVQGQVGKGPKVGNSGRRICKLPPKSHSVQKGRLE